MTGKLSPPVENWGPEEQTAFLRRLGLKLEAGHVNEKPVATEEWVREITWRLAASEIERRGNSSSIEDAVYEVTREVVADDSDAHAFGEDIVNASFFQDFFWDERHTSLIWVGSDRGLGFSDGVMVLDFGSEKVFAARAPNEDMGRHGWQVLAALERGDTEALRSVVCGYIEQDWLLDSLSVADFVPRVDIEEAFATALDDGHTNGWADLARVLADSAPETEFSIDSPEQRAECLSAYLGIALSQ